MKEQLEDLIQHYKNKIHYLSEMLKEKGIAKDNERLKTKISVYRVVITDLENLLSLQNETKN